MKKFISGLIIGLMLSASAVFADTYNIIQNSFPVYVDGTEQSIDALNINGSTWIRLGSISGVLGASATFDEVNKQINIATGGDQVTEESSTTTKIKPTYYTQDELSMMDYNGIKYVKRSSIYSKNSSYMRWKYDDINKILTLCKPNKGDDLIDNIPYILVSDEMWIEYTYYTDTILPLIQ